MTEIEVPIENIQEDIHHAIEHGGGDHNKMMSALLHKHERLATSVTFFQIAIALTAIAVLARRGQFMSFPGLLGLCGLGYLAFGLLHF